MDDSAHSPQENKSIVKPALQICLFALSLLCCVGIGIGFFFSKQKKLDIKKKKNTFNF